MRDGSVPNVVARKQPIAELLQSVLPSDHQLSVSAFWTVFGDILQITAGITNLVGHSTIYHMSHYRSKLVFAHHSVLGCFKIKENESLVLGILLGPIRLHVALVDSLSHILPAG